MKELTLRHRGRRAPQHLPMANGEYLELMPGDTKTGQFHDEYAELLKHRSEHNDVVEVLAEKKSNGEDDDDDDDQGPDPLGAGLSRTEPRGGRRK